MPANRVPNVDVPPIDLKTGKWNVIVWRYLASLAAQFSGVDPPVMPVNVPGILSIANAQAKPAQMTEAAVMEAAQRILGALRPNGRQDGSAAELSAIALSRIPPRQPALAPQIVICTQATFPALVSGTAEMFIYVSDYKHWICWNGTTPEFADEGAGWVAEGRPDGSAPEGGLWGLCDGSIYAVLKSDGTTQNIATVDRTNDSFPEGSTTFGAKAASRAKWEAAAVTDDESAHTHQVDPPSTTSGNDSGAGTVVQSGAGSTVATHTHTHDTNIPAFASAAGSAHHHVLSDANAQLKVPSEANGGLPDRVGVSYFIRR